MKIALIGYGKMGKTIETLGKSLGHSFPLIIDENNPGDLNAESIRDLDAAIEFTVPTAAPENISICLKLGLPVVSGTTGWNSRLPEIENLCEETEGCLFHASNFSIGVNILFALNRQLARIMDRFPAYRVSMEEVHHIHKLDAPSGTAISLAEQIIDESSRLDGWKLQGTPEGDKLLIQAVREGEVKGRHTITYESELDCISLSHDAKSREAFAAGALLAAEFVNGKKGVFGMTDLLKL